MQYLQDYNEEPGRRFMTLAVNRDGRTAMICPALAGNQAERAGIQNIRTWKDGEDPIALFKALSEEWNLKSGILAVDDETPAGMLLPMQQTLPAALFRKGGQIFAELTKKKEQYELDLMIKAGSIADKAFPRVTPHLKPGVTEEEITGRLFDEMSKLGGKPTFAVAAAGAFGAEPHHMSDSSVIKDGDVVVMDFGCSVEGYNSDITRTVCCGRASDEAKQVYDVVLRSHWAAREAIRPGVKAESIDQAARAVIADAGYGEFFFHRTGHGIGLRIHEDPFIVEGNTDPLSAGETFSIEPGIYLKGNFGVRIENIVYVTENGHASFNEDPSSVLAEIL